MDSNKNYLCLTLLQMIEDLSGTKWNYDTILHPDDNRTSFPIYLSAYLDKWKQEFEHTPISLISNNFLSDLSYCIFIRYANYIPIYTLPRLTWEIYRTICFGSKELNDSVLILLNSLLTKYNLPTIGNDPLQPDYSWDKLSAIVAKQDKTSNTTNGATKVKSQGTSTNESTTTNDGKGWTRTRPINYKTTDENTADAVNGSNSTSSDNSSSNSDNTTDKSYNDTGSTESTSTDKNYFLVLHDLQINTKSLWQRLIDSFNYLFINSFAV